MLDAVGDWACPAANIKTNLTSPVRFNNNGVIVCMSNNGGKTCITGTADQCKAQVASPVDGKPAANCTTTQMRTPANAFCYGAAQALMPFPLDKCEQLYLTCLWPAW
jgi:hypothetical protein